MRLAIDQAGQTVHTAATSVTVVELSRGDQPGWILSFLPGAALEFVSGHLLLIAAAGLGFVAFAAWLAVRKYGVTGVAGVQLLTGMALRGRLRSVRRIIWQSRKQGISLAAAALSDD